MHLGITAKVQIIFVPSKEGTWLMGSVIVTGGSGKLGQFAVRHLTEVGFEVVSVDQARHPDPKVMSVIADLRDAGAVMDLFTGVNEKHTSVEAVVHLAAIPAPGILSDKATIDNNFNSSLNVFMAARNAGVKKIVFASSETVLGLPFDTPPPYVPVDENLEPRPESFYSLSKVLEERVAREFCRWDEQLSMNALRFSNVIDPAEYPSFRNFQGDPYARKWNLWGYIDARDGALAIEKALRFDKPGFEAFIIASPDSVMELPNDELLETVFPDVQKRRPITDHETLLGIDKAREVLSFNPEHTWRDSSDD